MAKFRVGDMVIREESAVVIRALEDPDDTQPYLIEYRDGARLWAAESELTPLAPAIPSGWTPASEPPDGIRDVLVMLKGGEKRIGWYSESAIISGGNWYLYPEGTTPKSIDDDDTSFDDTPAAPGEVLAWCEIEPDAKVDTGWYIVTDQLFKITHAEAVELALELAKKGKASYIARVVEEVKPGKPEVIRMEE